MAVGKRFAPLDDLTKFAEGLALTASDVVQRDSADYIIDVGAALQEFLWVVDVSNITDIANNNEVYSFLLQGSNSSTFASGIENLAIIQLGATEVRLGGAQDSVVGRYQSIVYNMQAGVVYKYLRLNVIIAGTVSTGVTFSSWLSKPSEA